ncbi:MAG: ABC transporter ATP-binding protein [Planctomycetota bacterium]
MSTIEVIEVSKSFGSQPQKTLALRDVSLTIASGSRCVMFGCSGAGKSTLLRIIAGLETADRGTVKLNGHDAARLKPALRGVSLLSQDVALYPQRTVEQNVAISAKKLKLERAALDRQVQQMLEQFSIAELRNKLPSEISGGEMQRVALAKALISQPQILLLDEPLSQLDGQTKEAAVDLLNMVQSEYRPTTVMVTHDPLDAMRMSDTLAVLGQGELIDAGEPDRLYKTPTSRIGGSLLSPFGMNWIDMDLLGEAKNGMASGKFLGFRPEDAALEGRQKEASKVGAEDEEAHPCFADEEACSFAVEISGVQTFGFARLYLCRFLHPASPTQTLRVLGGGEKTDVGQQAICRVPREKCCSVDS